MKSLTPVDFLKYLVMPLHRIRSVGTFINCSAKSPFNSVRQYRFQRSLRKGTTATNRGKQSKHHQCLSLHSFRSLRKFADSLFSLKC
jgi:hypothetical protein